MELSCAIKGCEAGNVLLFKYPNPEKHLKLFIEWVRATGDESLLGYHPLEIYYTLRVCQSHFEEEHFRKRSHTKPVPYLNMPEPISVPTQWIVSITKSDNIDNVEYDQQASYIESDIIETAGFIDYTYTTVGHKNWYLFRNTFMVAPDNTDDDEERNNFSRLWSVPRANFKPLMPKCKRKRMFGGRNLKKIKKYATYIITSPSDYYSIKFKHLVKMYTKINEENTHLWNDNHKLKRKVRELKKLLFLKHI